ncbi:hypothetical protein CYY_004152 [Polysphondylium violaceum]|uniref:Phosphatidylinositol-3,4,5-trisphosphate 3-phosphatase n=1 Tax=Polysphondylium violaceum TaxID=133409 RepID=A0A8J4PWL7_9MYCE|nr:hypothetical protein CYY_004152 [Polysphondylium violaceum]
MYNSIVKAVRKTISADKTRFENETYDLDLTYICERVIAMSFPADGVESAYRNSIYDVSQMLNENHKDHYLVFNLSERKYEYGLFNDKVYDWCGFPDHNAPPLGLLFKIVKTIHKWLEADPLNVVIVHCLAGKGRTGTVIACLLLYGGLFNNASDAMKYFAVKRSNNNYGITGPSQIRYTQYFSDIYLNGREVNPSPVFLKSITMNTIPKFFLGPLKQGVCPVLNIYSATQKGVRIFTSAPIEGDTKETRTYLSGNATLIFEVRKIVRGDVLVVFSHVTPFYRVEQICRANFHTGMFSMPTLVLHKSELDGADGDKRFSSDFFLKVDFQEVVSNVGTQESVMLEHQKEIKKEVKWILHDIRDSIHNNSSNGSTSANNSNRNGSIFFLPKNNSEKIKQAKDIVAANKQGSFGVHSGFLLKKGQNFKSWRRRWFVLKENVLSYYKSPKDTTPAGCILVTDIVNLEIDIESSQREGYDYCFQIQTSKATYLISAENERDLEDWTEILKSAVRMVQVCGRLFLEILQVRYEFNNPTISKTPFDIISYLTVTLGKKRDTTSQQSQLFTPQYQYAGQFEVYDKDPLDLVISFWIRSSVLAVKDTLVADLVIPANQLQQKLNTEWRPFTMMKSNFLSNLSIQFGMVYRSENDINLYESALGLLQSPNANPNNSSSNNHSGLPTASPSTSFDQRRGGTFNFNQLNLNSSSSPSTSPIITTHTTGSSLGSAAGSGNIYLAKARENSVSGGNNNNIIINNSQPSLRNSKEEKSTTTTTTTNTNTNSNSSLNNSKESIDELYHIKSNSSSSIKEDNETSDKSFLEDLENQLNHIDEIDISIDPLLGTKFINNLSESNTNNNNIKVNINSNSNNSDHNEYNNGFLNNFNHTDFKNSNNSTNSENDLMNEFEPLDNSQ